MKRIPRRIRKGSLPLGLLLFCADSSLAWNVDLAAGVASERKSGALAVYQLFGAGLLDGLSVGAGARFSAFLGGRRLGYTSADATLISQNQVNTLTIDIARTYSVNAAGYVEYEPLGVAPGLALGFNIDLVGFGFGNRVVGSYAATDPALAGAQGASASGFNVLLGGKPDRGQLNSELYLAYRLAGWAVRAGLSHFISEYTADRALDLGNDRFRISSNILFVSVGTGF